jgi:hypothetical protein
MTAMHAIDSTSGSKWPSEYVMNGGPRALCRGSNKSAFPFETRHNPA